MICAVKVFTETKHQGEFMAYHPKFTRKISLKPSNYYYNLQAIFKIPNSTPFGCVQVTFDPLDQSFNFRSAGSILTNDSTLADRRNPRDSS